VPKSSPQVSTDPRPLTGEPLCLDLLNTRWVGSAGEEDLLDCVDGLAVWLHSAGLADRATADEATLAALRETRGALLAVVHDGSGAARDALNRVLAHGVLRQSLGPEGPQTCPETDDAAWLPAWLAASDYLRLVAVDPRRIKRCAAHPQCILHFHDTSKNNTRRWCSMAACGNRAKAARHYARSKNSGSGSSA
jgi:predicted RNA-binding Zn ribbon-like protein